MKKNTNKPRPYRSEQDMIKIISQWRKSGLSKVQFCDQHHLPYSVLQYWLKKVDKEKSKPEPAFIELALTNNNHSASIEIIFPTGAKAVFNNQVDSSFIRSLVY